jgi:UDP-N-acetylmuramoylalanine--D-glutamate ligase
MDREKFTQMSREGLIKRPHSSDFKRQCFVDAFTDPMLYPHRLERVTEVNGVVFINDSWSTSVNATWFAFEDLNTDKIVWIAGGLNNGNDYSPIIEIVKKKVKTIICLGVDNYAIQKSFHDCLMIINTEDVREAILKAYEFAEPGDTVLFSPACVPQCKTETAYTRGEEFEKQALNLFRDK